MAPGVAAQRRGPPVWRSAVLPVLQVRLETRNTFLEVVEDALTPLMHRCASGPLPDTIFL